jgi:DNA polymerase-3 subunit chi
MTRVDFYIINNQSSREQIACKITEKAYQQDNRIHIHTESSVHSKRMDDLLWVYDEESFIPHDAGPSISEHSTVCISHEAEPACHDVLINLSSDVPVFFSRFERVAEIIDQDPQRKQQGRERYRFYQDRGYELKTHQIGGA